jgi:hypothetical protein
MELRHLRYFVGVAETENVSRAALKESSLTTSRSSATLFTQSFHIYKFIEWHRWLLPWIMFEVDTS